MQALKNPGFGLSFRHAGAGAGWEGQLASRSRDFLPGFSPPRAPPHSAGRKPFIRCAR
ncbi:hypothetical protein ASZ90_008963 [hydrocarbon metagenome]|uniref:Uncharacterized protein n=1 Tax=hydrocarbon metagenome TaxID=938273 RepID=A0A0W8FK21_9ZZZZ